MPVTGESGIHFSEDVAIGHPGRVATGFQRLAHPVADTTLIVCVSLFDIGKEQIDALAGFHAGCGFRLAARLGEILGVESGLGDDQQGFDIVGTQMLQTLCLLQPVDGAIAAARTEDRYGRYPGGAKASRPAPARSWLSAGCLPEGSPSAATTAAGTRSLASFKA